MKGGRTSTTWKKGENPTMKKGTKQKSTLLKESIGLSSWEKLVSYIKNEGAEKVVQELAKLESKDFLNSYGTLVEFVKPKLQRTTLDGKTESKLIIEIVRRKAGTGNI